MIVPDGRYVAGVHVRAIRHDQWRIRQRNLPPGYFKTYLDIGANVGYVCLQMRVLSPRARICAIEPCRTTYDALVTNMTNLFVETEQVALGDGRPAIMTPGSNSMMHQWRSSDETEGGNTCPTLPFADICEHFKIDPQHAFVKIDTEGAERVLIGDSKAEELLSRFKMVGFEFHSKPRINDPVRIEDYEAWVRDRFSKTHDITIGWTSRPDTNAEARLDRK